MGYMSVRASAVAFALAGLTAAGLPSASASALGSLDLGGSASTGAPGIVDQRDDLPEVRVRWNRGSGPAQMDQGLPNPPGWYRAAVGPRRSDKVLYLTFDDGPSSHTASLLAGLRRHQAEATFFVTGAAARSRPGLIRRIARQGHALGNHTWGHPRLTRIPTAAVRSELRRTRRTVGSAMGDCMRPPYGLVDRRVATASIKAGFQPVLWTAHIEDWVPHNKAWTVERLRRATRPGAVILMHDTHATTVAAVSEMLPRWRARGYRLETVPVCS